MGGVQQTRQPGVIPGVPPMATANDDPDLGEGPSEDSDILLDECDSESLFSDDSVFPEYERDDEDKEPSKTLYEACAKNDPTSLRRIMARGITKEEAMELDINGKVSYISYSFLSHKSRNVYFCDKAQNECKLQQKSIYFFLVFCQNGLMLAVSKGFVDIVTILHTCPLIDINHQDNDGNTALMIAAQAGRYEDGTKLHPALIKSNHINTSSLVSIQASSPF